DPAANPKTQGHARSRTLGGEAAFEDPAADLRRNSRPAVGDLDPHDLVFLSGCDSYFARSVDGLSGIQEQIHEHLVELIAARFNHRGSAEFPGDLDAPFQLMSQQRESAFNRVVNIRDFRFAAKTTDQTFQTL